MLPLPLPVRCCSFRCCCCCFVSFFFRQVYCVCVCFFSSSPGFLVCCCCCCLMLLKHFRRQHLLPCAPPCTASSCPPCQLSLNSARPSSSALKLRKLQTSVVVAVAAFAFLRSMCAFFSAAISTPLSLAHLPLCALSRSRALSRRTAHKATLYSQSCVVSVVAVCAWPPFFFFLIAVVVVCFLLLLLLLLQLLLSLLDSFFCINFQAARIFC